MHFTTLKPDVTDVCDVFSGITEVRVTGHSFFQRRRYCVISMTSLKVCAVLQTAPAAPKKAELDAKAAEEEAKNKLAEKRRQAREEAERKAEEERRKNEELMYVSSNSLRPVYP